MKTKIYPDSLNYTCQVVKITNLHLLEGLDRIQGTNIYGNQVLVGIETKIDDVGLYFPVECQIAAEFLAQNNLFAEKELNVDVEKKGYFSKTGRVKAQKFYKGKHNSTGFWIPLTSLSFYTDITKLNVGDEFNEIDGMVLAKKYVVNTGKSSQPSSQRVKELTLKDLVDTRCFKEHVDTSHLLKNTDRLNLYDLMSISVKIHGTSIRISNTPVYEKPNLITKVLTLFRIKTQKFTYRYVNASRKVIKSVDFKQLDRKQQFYQTNIWDRAGILFKDKLHKGETLYAEIYGWDGEKPIKKGYTYSLPQGQFKLAVYRISFTNEDGITQDLTWNALKTRCEELGVEYVPEVYFGSLRNFLGAEADSANWQEIFQQKMISMLEQPSIFSSPGWKMVEEGFVVQVYKLGISDYYKIKAPSFLQHESKILDEGISDIETDESQCFFT